VEAPPETALGPNESEDENFEIGDIITVVGDDNDVGIIEHIHTSEGDTDLIVRELDFNDGRMWRNCMARKAEDCVVSIGWTDVVRARQRAGLSLTINEEEKTAPKVSSVKHSEDTPPAVHAFGRHAIAFVMMMEYMLEHWQSLEMIARSSYTCGVIEPEINRAIMNALEKAKTFAASIATLPLTNEDYAIELGNAKKYLEYRPVEDLAVFMQMIHDERKRFQKKPIPVSIDDD
jgi:hypothetical protein